MKYMRHQGWWQTLIIVLLPTLVFFVNIYVLKQFYYDAEFPIPQERLHFTSDNPALEVTYRYTSATMFIICASVSVGAFLVAFHVMWIARARFKMIFALLLGGLVFIATILDVSNDLPKALGILIEDHPKAGTALKIMGYTRYTNAIIAFASIALFFAAATLWFRDALPEKRSIGERAAVMTNRLAILKRLILMASSICLSGTFLFSSWIRLPLGFLEDTEGAFDIYRNAARGLVLYNSSTFFLVLLFGFFPIFTWLRAENRKLFSGYHGDNDPRIEENREAFSNVLWVPLPLLVSFAASLEPFIRQILTRGNPAV